MSPKAWSNQVTITQGQIQEVIYQHQKVVERLHWKAMSPLEFGESMIDLMKGLAKHTVRINTTEFRGALSKAKVALTCEEADLLTEKVSHCIKVVKKRLRDAGSGVHLPAIAVAMQRLWKKHAKPVKKGGKKGHETVAVGNLSKNDSIRDIFGLPPKMKAPEVSLLSQSSEEEDRVGTTTMHCLPIHNHALPTYPLSQTSGPQKP